jgi:diguanylate cyclase
LTDSAAIASTGSSTLQRRLLLLVGLSLLPFAIFMFYSAWQLRESGLESSRSEVLTVSRLIARDISQVAGHTEQLLGALAAVAAGNGIAGSVDALCRRLGMLIDSNPRYVQGIVASPSGEMQCSARPIAGPLNLSDRPYFQRMLDRRAFAFSGLIRSRADGHPTMVGAYPLLDSHGLRGALLLSIDLDWLRELMAQTRLPGGAVVSLVDGSGQIVARFPNGDQYVGRPVPDRERFLTAIAGAQEGVDEARGHDAVDRVVAFARVPGFVDEAMYVRVGIPKDLADAQSLQLLTAGLVLLVLVTAIALLVARVASKRLVLEPFEKLITAAGRLGAGDLSARTGIAHDGSEIGALAAKLDQLATRVQRHERALRTLSGCNRNLIREQSGQEMLDRMCLNAVERGGYRAAAVYMAQGESEGGVTAVAHAGAVPGLFRAFGAVGSQAHDPDGMVARAIRTGEPCAVRNVPAEPWFDPWRNDERAGGIGSMIALPLRVEGEIIGAYVLVAAEPDAFDQDELELLREMADDTAFGIGMQRSRVRRDTAEALVARAATHDPLTGLPNRSSLLAHLAVLVDGEAGDQPSEVAVLAVHILRLQDLVDGLGYDPANRVVVEMADRLQSMNIPQAFIARVSVDDFCVVLPREEAGRAATLGLSICKALTPAVQIDTAQIEVQVAVGCSIHPVHADDGDLLARRAVLAAREGGRRDAPYYVYSGATQRENPARLALVSELRSAIDGDQLRLFYQPKIDIASGRVVAAEALVRWFHPQRGMVPPVEFIPVAEQTGLIRPMTLRILELAVKQQRAWSRNGVQVPIAVNVSARSLLDPKWQLQLTGMLAQWDVAPGLIEIEITESALVEEPAVAAVVLSTLRESGFRIYIDDFGTGYSSLSYLVTLPAHALKIDRSFVVAMGRSREAYSVVSSVVSMAHGLGLRVVAEGVETENDLTMLDRLGCDEAQGYFIAKPLPAEEFEAWLERVG